MTDENWACDAYGEAGLEVGAACFRSPEPGGRVCGSQLECGEFMFLERARLFRRLHELAAAGDELSIAVLEGITSPAQLLNGPAAFDRGDDRA